MNIPGGVVQRRRPGRQRSTSSQSDRVVVDALRPLDEPQYAEPDDRRTTDRRPSSPLGRAPTRGRTPTMDTGDAAWPRPTTAATPTSTSGRWSRAPRAAATVVRVGHHRPRPGRAGRHRLRAAARGRRRGGAGQPDRRGRVDQVGVRRLRAGRRRRDRGQRRARPTPPRPSTPTPTARAGWSRSPCPATAVTPRRRCWTPPPTRPLVDAS